MDWATKRPLTTTSALYLGVEYGQLKNVYLLSAYAAFRKRHQGPLPAWGGSSAVQFRAQMKQVMADTPELDYVFADGGNWFRDPPGGKMEPTQDPDWDKASIELVKDLVVNQGPFDVVLGFSQGSAFIPAYLSIHSTDFRKAALLSGYLPSTHQGVLKRIQAAAPFSLPALVYLGKEDDIIPYPMTREQAMLLKMWSSWKAMGGITSRQGRRKAMMS